MALAVTFGFCPFCEERGPEGSDPMLSTVPWAHSRWEAGGCKERSGTAVWQGSWPSPGTDSSFLSTPTCQHCLAWWVRLTPEQVSMTDMVVCFSIKWES